MNAQAPIIGTPKAAGETPAAPHPDTPTATADTRPAPNSLNGARLLVRTLERLGVDTIFGYPGGAIMPVYDALTGSGLKHILVRHEQGAAFAADAYARMTGRPGVCLATSGPGATNLITGIANAYMDSVPMVAITGQVASGLMGTDAFQEVDIFGMTLPIVKHSYLIRDAAQIPAVLEEAFAIAATGRPGPVLIDLPKDVAASTPASLAASVPMPRPPLPPSSQALAAAEALIAQAKRPILYIGYGAGIAQAEAAVRAFVEATGIPAVATLKGLGVLPTDHPDFIGMLGMHGTRAANNAVQDSDLLICCGARFDDRATGKLDTFAPNADIIHLDADVSEISKLRRADVAIPGDLNEAMTRLAEAGDRIAPEIAQWRTRIIEEKTAYAFPYHQAPGDGVYAPDLLRDLSTAAGDKFVAACDVGQHQMWAAQHCRFARPQAHLTSGGLGAMGYGLPAGIGAKLAEPDAEVIVISGDGSIMMNIQELATLKRYGIAVKVVLLDNSGLGLVRQWQELFYAENYSEIDLSDNPDFTQVSRAFGVDAFSISKREEVPGAIERILNAKGSILAHVRIDPKENVWPLVPPGKSNADMMEE